MTAELGVQSRFKVTDAPTELPGSCAVCGSTRTDDRKYVEFGLKQLVPTDDPYMPKVWGRVYFCTYCLSEAARVIGMISSSDAKYMDVMKQQYSQDIAEARAFIEGEYLDRYGDSLKQHIAHLRSLFPDRSWLADDSAKPLHKAPDGSTKQGSGPPSKSGPDDFSGNSSGGILNL